MKHFYCGFCMALSAMLFIGGTARGCAEEAPVTEIWFFHNTACGTCDGTEEFRNLISDQLSMYKEIYPYELKLYNTFKTEGRDKLESMLEEYDLAYDDLVFPVMLLNGEAYMGMKSIAEKIRENYLDAVDYSAIYFYREDCQECIDLQPFMDKISGQTEEEGELADFRLISLETRTDDNGDVIRALFGQYEVPDEDQMVPIVFLKDTYLAGQEPIERELQGKLEQGMGIGETTGINKGESENEIVVSKSGKMLE